MLKMILIPRRPDSAALKYLKSLKTIMFKLDRNVHFLEEIAVH